MFKKAFFAAVISAVFGFAGYNYLSTEKPDVQLISTAATKVQRNLLLISDMHVISPQNTESDPGDASMTLFKSYISKTDSVLNHTAPLDFIIYSGDLPAHAGLGPISRSNIPGHDSDLVTALRGLQKLANNHPGIPLFYLPGNNDSETGDYYPFGDNNNSAFGLVNDSKNPFPALNVNHGSKKIPCLIEMGDKGLCYYSAYPVEGLRLIALNTVVYTKYFAEAAGNVRAICDKQMNWLAAQLDSAKKNNEKVYIAMHVPPRNINYKTYVPDGYGWTNKVIPGNTKMKTYDQWFFSLLNNYKDSCLEAVFYGHTHMDELYLLQEKRNSEKLGVAVSCPGLAYNHGNNPGFKTVSFDSASKSLLDFTTYYTNPGAAETGNWGTNSYSFSSIFQSNPAAQTMFERLSIMKEKDIAAGVRKIYKVNAR